MIQQQLGLLLRRLTVSVAAVRGNTEWECGLISKHIRSQLARCNPLFHFLNFNVLVPTGFVLVGQKTIIIIIIIKTIKTHAVKPIKGRNKPSVT